MPTPMGTGSMAVASGIGTARFGSWRGDAVRITIGVTPGRKGWTERGRSRENPPQESGPEEACDERSLPHDVTSSWSDAEGSICSKRSYLSGPKDLLATPRRILAAGVL